MFSTLVKEGYWDTKSTPDLRKQLSRQCKLVFPPYSTWYFFWSFLRLDKAAPEAQVTLYIHMYVLLLNWTQTDLSCCPWGCWCWAVRQRSFVWRAGPSLPGRCSTEPWSAWRPGTTSEEGGRHMSVYLRKILLFFISVIIFRLFLPALCEHWGGGLTPGWGRVGEALDPGFWWAKGKGRGCSGYSV